MALRLLVIGLLVASSGSAYAQVANKHGQLTVLRPGRGTIDPNSGNAAFKFRGWQLIPAVDSDGISPGTEPIEIGIAEERFLIPVGLLKVSKNGKRFSYRAKTDRGIRNFLLKLRPDGTYRVSLSLSGVDLSALVIKDPPLCLPFAIIIGNDDGFSGVSFDRPRPFPSRLLTLPGFCTDEQTWPWT